MKLMMPSKITDLLKITVFWNKGYDVIIPVDEVTNKILPRDSNYIVDVIVWPNFDNSTILSEKLSQPQFYKDSTRKSAFFEGWSWFKFNNFGLALGTNLKTSKAEKLKLKVRKFLASYTGKAGKWDLFAATPILNRVSYNEQPAIVLCRRWCLAPTPHIKYYEFGKATSIPEEDLHNIDEGLLQKIQKYIIRCKEVVCCR